MKKLIMANWKMNGNAALISEFAEKISENSAKGLMAEMVICPAFPYLMMAYEKLSHLAIGAQDCSAKESGAYTGEISTIMAKESGASFVIIGHSERRQYHKESNDLLNQKITQALAQGLIPVYCVGETKEEREAGQAESVVATQLAEGLTGIKTDRLVIAYEPVWAIGTGIVASLDDIRAMHGFIQKDMAARKAAIPSCQILYGGSVKPENAGEILAIPSVDGALVGGASLDPVKFLAIAQAAPKMAAA